MNVAGDAPFIGHTPRLLAGDGDALLAKDLLGLDQVTPGFLQGHFAVHHARAGLIAQFLHDLGVNCLRGCCRHFIFWRRKTA
jgi:hypothetical protein